MVMRKDIRTCNECSAEMEEGYCIEGGIEYYCSDACLHKHISPREWRKLYAGGEGDSYYTNWYEDPEADWYEDGEPAPTTDDPEVKMYIKMLELRVRDLQSLVDLLRKEV